MIRQLAHKLFQQVIRRLGRGSQTISDLSSTERGALLRLKLKVLTNTWSVARYPTRPYPGHVDLFLTRETQRYFFHPGYGWHQLGAESVTLHDIPGTHATITGDNAPIEAAHMQVLAQKLRQRMDENKVP